MFIKYVVTVAGEHDTVHHSFLGETDELALKPAIQYAKGMKQTNPKLEVKLSLFVQEWVELPLGDTSLIDEVFDI